MKIFTTATALKSQLLGLSVLLGIGLLLPAVARSAESTPEPRADDRAARSIAQGAVTSTSEAELSGIKIEEHLQAAENTLAREYSFAGNANEIIVVYWASEAARWADIRLLDSAGQGVSSYGSYPSYLQLSEIDGRHQMFFLPETGEYRLLVDNRYLYAANGEEPEPAAAEASAHLLRVRVASYYERLMLSAEDMLDDRRYEDSVRLFSLAVEHSPELPQPYVGRVIARGQEIYDTSGIDESAEDFTILAGFEQLYDQLAPEAQPLVLADLRQAAANYQAMIASGQAPSEEDFDPALFSEVANFLETGVATDRLTEMVEMLL